MIVRIGQDCAWPKQPVQYFSVSIHSGSVYLCTPSICLLFWGAHVFPLACCIFMPVLNFSFFRQQSRALLDRGYNKTQWVLQQSISCCSFFFCNIPFLCLFFSPYCFPLLRSSSLSSHLMCSLLQVSSATVSDWLNVRGCRKVNGVTWSLVCGLTSGFPLSPFIIHSLISLLWRTQHGSCVW